MKLIQRLNSLFILLPLALLVVVFALLNRSPVSVDLFVGNVDGVPLFAWVLGALAIGVLMGLGIAWMSAGRLRRRARTGERKAKALEGEVAEMRHDFQAQGRETPPAEPRGGRLALRSRAAAGDR